MGRAMEWGRAIVPRRDRPYIRKGESATRCGVRSNSARGTRYETPGRLIAGAYRARRVIMSVSSKTPIAIRKRPLTSEMAP